MSLLNLEVLEKVKPTLTSLIEIFFGVNKRNKKDSQPVSDVFSDKFVKTGTDNLTSTPLTRRVWVNGQAYTIIGFSQMELNKKIEQIQQKKTILTDEKRDVNPLLFHNLYTEQREVEVNEWVEKRDVWVDEYYPA